MEGTRCRTCGEFFPVGDLPTKVWTSVCPKCGGLTVCETLKERKKGLFGKLFLRKKKEPRDGPRRAQLDESPQLVTPGDISRARRASRFSEGVVAQPHPDSSRPTLQQLSTPLFPNAPESRDDESSVAEAHSLMSNRRWSEAMDLIQRSLQSCKRKDRLCELMANIKLNEGNPIAIGWDMQACALASPSWVPYLFVSYAARAIGFEKLAWRCLNACDVLDIGMKRIDRAEAEIRAVARAADRSELLAAMKSFEAVMSAYLPLPDALPHDEYARSVDLLQNISDMNEPPLSFRTKLLRRP